jgi:hypothetical protein
MHMLITDLFISIAATTAMTLFSAFWSRACSCQYVEPVILNKILSRSNLTYPDDRFIGWFIHYAVGFGFCVFYSLAWPGRLNEHDALSWMTAAIASGFVGVLGWRLAFAVCRMPSKRPVYYVHIFAAHLVFTLVASLIFVAVW